MLGGRCLVKSEKGVDCFCVMEEGKIIASFRVLTFKFNPDGMMHIWLFSYTNIHMYVYVLCFQLGINK